MVILKLRNFCYNVEQMLVSKIVIFYSMWEFHDFPITQILREIKFGASRSAKSAIWTHLQALNMDFYEFLYFLKVEIYLINKTQSP